jgi:RNA polymerase sigma-70 factor (ECF subfamily)
VAIAAGRPEAELIAAAKEGNAVAFAALYDLFADRVYRHILYRTGNPADSEDLTQQTFLKAWQAMGRYRVTEVPFVAWLLTIAHNAVVSHFRSKRDHVPLDLDLPLPDTSAGPQEEAERKFHQAAVRRALAKLPHDQQQVVVMRYLDEFDYADIAKALKKTENNVRVIAHRALKRMQRSLEATT